MQAVTETSNDITQDIDVASAIEIVRLLCSCDAEIFSGWHDYPNIRSAEIVDIVGRIATVAADILKEPSNNVIVLSGCGTSGRLAFILCRAFNKLQREQGVAECYEYVIAGGDKALFTSQEAPEDDPHAGIQALKQVSQGKKRVLFIGISCGLSAPFVAGQLEYCMDHNNKYITVLLGFNPISQARDISVENWDKTFLQVTKRLEDMSRKNPDKYFILNPVLGPEAVTGSSRMKGGSVTKIILEIIFTISHIREINDQMKLQDVVQCLLSVYEVVYETTYSYADDISTMVEWAATSLNNNGHVYYIGVNSLATLGIIDASECPPTYSATLEDIRGFIYGGYTTYGNREGDISSLGEPFNISVEHFQEDLISKLSSKDTVLFLLTYQDLCNLKDTILTLSKSIVKYTNLIGAIYFKNPYDGDIADNTIVSSVLSHVKHITTVTLPWQHIQQSLSSVFPPCSGKSIFTELNHLVSFLNEISLKWMLNAISTGSHIMKGKVYKNVMIDVKVSNNKLYHRAIGIMQRFADCSLEDARSALLKSIYKTDDISDEQDNAAISKHIDTATSMNKVVPVALLLATRQCRIHDAMEVLDNVIRVQDALKVLDDIIVVSKAIQMTK